MTIGRISALILASVALLTSLLPRPAQAGKSPGLSDELNPSQLKIIQEGGRVMVTVNVSGQPWPSVKVYQVIAAQPEQIMAVFFDYEAAATYVPHVLQSTISKKIDARTHEVSYRMTIPPLPEERYTIRNTLHPVAAGGIYEIDWKLLRATSTRASEGSFRVQAYGKNQSIFCYTNLVVPGTRLAIVLRGLALEQVQKNIDALIQEVGKRMTQSPDSLRHQIEVLRTALSEPANP